MKTKTLLLVLAILPTTLYGQSTAEPNVLSYYAVGNSLDGQPMIDMPNVLRFFPVYAMQEQTESVCVTIYYGGSIYTRFADGSKDKKYWEVSLPRFRLGDAIQKIEIAVRFRLKPEFSQQLRNVQSTQSSSQTQIETFDRQLKLDEAGFKKSKKIFAESIKDVDKDFASLGITRSLDADRLRIAFEKGGEIFAHVRDSLLTALNISNLSYEDSAAIELFASERSRRLREYLQGFGSYRENVSRKKLEQSESMYHLALLRDSLISVLERGIELGLLDTLYTGPSVRKSDLIIDADFSHASILYRNYKTSLRYMTALDPAERLGIFRIRYVPFPVFGSQTRPRMSLSRPMSTTSPTIFEVGLAFGDAVVPGDQFLVPEFSWRRLGIAFAISERLFSDSAEVIGLALTYDFNSYGSIGIGGNFARNEVHGYASLGINKKAFEAVIKGLAGLFK